MASYTFSSLRDMLKQPPSHNSKLMESLSSHPIPNIEVSHEDPHVIEIFGELYFKESSSSTQSFLAHPQPPHHPHLLHRVTRFKQKQLKSSITKPALRRRRATKLQKMGAFTTRDCGETRTGSFLLQFLA